MSLISAPATLERSLSAAERAQLVRMLDEPELAYLFKHALVQDTAYSSLLRHERKSLHRVVGTVLEELYPEQRDELAATLARHFAASDTGEKAIAYFVRAAARAREIYANAEAIAFYRAAIEHLERRAPHDAQLAELYEHLGDVLELTGQQAQARDAYAHAHQTPAPTARMFHARLYRKAGSSAHYQQNFGLGDEMFDAAERALGELSYDAPREEWQEWIQIQLDRMRGLYWRGDFRELETRVAQTQPILEQYGTPTLRYHFYDSLIAVDERRDRYIISETILQNARAMIAAARETGDERLLANGHFQLGFCLLMHDDFEQAEAELRTSEEMNQRIGNVTYQAFVLTYQSILYRRRNQIEIARSYIQQAHAATMAHKIVPHIAVAYGNLAWLALRDGDSSAVYEHGRAAVQGWAKSSFAYPFQWVAHLPLLAVSVQESNLDSSIESARVLTSPAQQRLPDPLDTWLLRAIQAFEQNDSNTARTCLHQVVEAAKQLHYL
jgi:eukaryotic-like serine/threonine-protein kinase